MASLKKGDKVTCSAEYDFDRHVHLVSWVRTDTFDVIQVGGSNLPDNRVVIGKGSAVTAAVDIKYLTKINTDKTKKLTEDELKPSAGNKGSANGKNPKKKDPLGAGDVLASMNEAAQNDLRTYAVNTEEHYQKIKIKNADGTTVVRMVDTKGTATPKDDVIYPYGEFDYRNMWTKTQLRNNKKLDQKEPMFVRTLHSDFPKKETGEHGQEFKKKYGYNLYNYKMNIHAYGNHNATANGFDLKLGTLEKAITQERSPKGDALRHPYTLLKYYETSYNRYKVQLPDDQLAKTFAHVFFVRPDCNIYKSGSGYSEGSKLNSYIKDDPEFYYTKKHSPVLLRELTQAEARRRDEFMMFISNKVRSFELSDEYINSDTFGQSLTGYKVPYGKHDIESKTAGKFSINYVDDKDLHLYNLHKLWIKYISGVYRGKFLPKKTYIKNRIIDYATCVYYFLCAEDGETVIFWSKYWGVFPLEAPSSAFSYNIENVGGINMPNFKIEYQYAWKEDFNPLTMVEFNQHSHKLKLNYVTTFNKSGLHMNPTWVGAPFIETFTSKSKTERPYTFKLRFRPFKADW